MWWENLVVLDALYRARTMSRAALALGVDKATVSRRIAELERTAPAPLFERRSGQIELTPYGARALSAFAEHERSRQRLVGELEHTESDQAGPVRVTAPAFVACTIIVPALRAFLAQHPRITLQLDGSNQVRDLTRAESDIALRNVRPRDGGLDVRKLGRMGFAMYASRLYLAERGGLLGSQKLAGHDMLSFYAGPYAGPGFEWLPEAALQARTSFCANDVLPLLAAAQAGLGLAVLPHFLGDAAPELERVPGGGEGVADIWLVAREEQRRIPRMRKVVQFLSELVRAHQLRLHAPSVSGRGGRE